MEQLINGDGFVVIRFKDNTCITIHTTLSPEILNEHGVLPKQNFFYDLDHGRFIPFRDDAVDIKVFEEKPKYNSEVLEFASRFI